MLGLRCRGFQQRSDCVQIALQPEPAETVLQFYSCFPFHGNVYMYVVYYLLLLYTYIISYIIYVYIHIYIYYIYIYIKLY